MGQLGNAAGIGSAQGQPAPVEVPGLAAVAALALGDDFTCAQTSNAIACWGSNQVGQLGSGGSYSTVPVVVGGL